MARIPQYPSKPNNWLHNGAEDYTRIFTDYILIDDSLPKWEECTTAEKEQWEAEHPQPEPIEEAEEV
jgi:hypothetical protein